MFLKAADKRSLVKNVYISLSASELDGLRLLGFLQPNVTGKYLALNCFQDIDTTLRYYILVVGKVKEQV